MPKILIGIPTFNGQVNVGLVKDLHDQFGDYKFEVEYEKRMRVEVARNKLALKTLVLNCDYLFFVDDDTRIDRDTIDKLVKLNTDIAVGIYKMRHPELNFSLSVYEGHPFQDNGATRYMYKPIEEVKEIREVDAAGTGCMLIRKEVIEKMFKKYGSYMFDFMHIDLKKEIEYNGSKVKRLNIGEDVLFCERAKRSGFKIKCDPTIRTEHIKEESLIYNPKDYGL